MRFKSLSGDAMATQPILDETLGFSDTVKFSAVRRSKFCDILTTRFDQTRIHGCYESYVNIEGGDISFFHDQKIYDITSGDVIFSKPGESHSCIYHSSCYLRL